MTTFKVWKMSIVPNNNNFFLFLNFMVLKDKWKESGGGDTYTYTSS